MAACQCIFVIKGLTKIYPGGCKVLANIWLSFLSGAMASALVTEGPNAAA